MRAIAAFVFLLTLAACANDKVQVAVPDVQITPPAALMQAPDELQPVEQWPVPRQPRTPEK